MEKFHNLPMEKQNTIINAALRAFGTNGYKKTSVSDIAAAAGISKAMVFHYFGTKKDLYLYLINFCSNLLMGEILDQFDNSSTDFFDRITKSTAIKVAVIRKHPATLSFLYSVYYEDNEEVKADIISILSQSEAFRNKIALEGTDITKFKDGVDIKLVMKMLVWMGEGFVNPYKNIELGDLDTLCNDFNESMRLLRNNLYKEEYL